LGVSREGKKGVRPQRHALSPLMDASILPRELKKKKKAGANPKRKNERAQPIGGPAGRHGETRNSSIDGSPSRSSEGEQQLFIAIQSTTKRARLKA